MGSTAKRSMARGTGWLERCVSRLLVLIKQNSDTKFFLGFPIEASLMEREFFMRSGYIQYNSMPYTVGLCVLIDPNSRVLEVKIPFIF